MTTEELKKKLIERQMLAEKAYTAYQQLEGQIALLKDMLKDAEAKELEADKKVEDNK